MLDSAHRPRLRSAAAGVVLALLVWLVPADLALSAFERACTMSCADTSSCCCKPSVESHRDAQSPSEEMEPNDGPPCRPDCAPATIVARGDSQGRSAGTAGSPSCGASIDRISTSVGYGLADAPLDRFASRAPPLAPAVV